MFRALMLGFLLSSGLLTVASAVIVSGGDGTQNTSGTGVSGWDYVGRIGSFNGVYLGQYGGGNWVLTAFHVVGGALGSDITIGGTFYTQVPGSGVRIKNTDNSDTDLVVYRINGDPGLSNLALRSSPLPNGLAVTMIGQGLNRDPNLTTWHVDTDTNPYTWSETPFPQEDATADGYKWGTGQTMRWGSNTVEGSSVIVNIGAGDVDSFFTDFDPVLNEGQGAGGDSGGGVFYLNGSTVELVGIMHAIGPFSGQPASTAVYGNTTYAADISKYNNAIVAAMIPEPSTYALWGFGGLFLIIICRKKLTG